MFPDCLVIEVTFGPTFTGQISPGLETNTTQPTTAAVRRLPIGANSTPADGVGDRFTRCGRRWGQNCLDRPHVAVPGHRCHRPPGARPTAADLPVTVATPAMRPDIALASEPCRYSSVFTALALTSGTATVSAAGGYQVGSPNPAARPI